MTTKLALACLLVAAGGSAGAQTLAEALGADPRFQTFAEALREVRLDDPPGVGTVFAPTDEAFGRVSDALLERIEDEAAEDVLRTIVALHLVPEGRHASRDLPVEMPTLADDLRIVVTYTRGTLTLRPAPPDAAADAGDVLAARAATESRVRVADLDAAGRLVHGIDMVMLPPDLEAMLDAAEAAARREDVPDAVAGTPTRPDDFAEQIADVDDGPTVAVVPTEDEAEVADPGAPLEVVTRTVPVRRLSEERDARPVDGGPAASGDPAPAAATADPATAAPGRLVTLPPEAAPLAEADMAPLGAATEVASDAPSPPDEPAIQLSSEVISLAELLGRPVRDGAGGDLGTVTDVLISLEGGAVRTLVYEEAGGVLSLDAIGIGEPETRQVEIADVSIDPLDGSVIVRDAGDDDAGDDEG